MADDKISKNLHLVYSALKSEGYTDIGDEQDFIKKMQNEQNRLKVYNALKGAGYSDMGSDFKSFSGMIYTAPTTAQASATQQPSRSAAPKQGDQARPQYGDYNPDNDPLLQHMKMEGKNKYAIPSFSDVVDQTAYKPMPEYTVDANGKIDRMPKPVPMFESEQTVDANGNIVSKPKPVPTFKNGRMGMGYHDMVTGEYYDINDPASESIVKNNTYTYESMKDLSAINRQQVGSMTKTIDDMLRDAEKKQLEEGNQAVNTLYDDDKNWFQKLGAAYSMSNQGNVLDNHNAVTANQLATAPSLEVQQLTAAKRSLRDAQRIIAEANKSVKEGNFDGFFKGAGRGFGNKLFDADTWDMGASDGSDAILLYATLKKADRGEKLTDAEQMMLDAKAVEFAINAYFGSYVGRGYNAGGATAESIPFMLEMCVNPASGAGKSAQGMLTRYALKRFGKQAVKNNAKKFVASKIGARLAGDIVGSSAMAATTGIGHVTAGTAERMSGDIIPDIDETTGETVYGGHTEGEDALTAFGKAFASTTIENYSEMVGEYFAPVTGVIGKGFSKGMNKIGLKGVNDFMENVAASDVARLVGDFEKHSKWNGVFGEYAEEVAGNMMNALVVGDMTMDTAEGTGVFNLDQNIDTFLGVSLMGGFMSGVKTLGYRTPKYRARKDMMKADNNAAALFTNPEDWGAIRNTIAFGSDEDVEAKTAEVVSNDDLTDQQKAAALKYIKSVEEYKGILRAEDSRRSEDNGTVDVDAETSYDNGYTLDTDEDMNDAKNMYDLKRGQMQELVTEDFLEQFDNDPVGSVAGLLNNDAFTEDEKRLALEYVNAKATYDGMIDRVRDDIDSRVEASNRAVDSHVNNQSGMIHPATLKINDRKVYVVDGKLVMHEDGSMVDIAKSSESILVRDAETGKLEWASPHDVLSVDDEIDPADEKEAAQAAIREQYAQQKADVIDGVLPFAAGDIYDILDEQGQQHQAKILQDNGDGTVQVSYDGAEAVTSPKTAIQDMADKANLARLQQFEQKRTVERRQKAAQEAQEQYEAQRPTYNLNDEVTLRGENGEPVRGSITTEENEDGQIEVYTETPINGKKIHLFTRQQIDDMLMEHNGETVVVAEAPAITAEIDHAGAVQSEPSTVQNVPAAEENVAVEPMPMVGKGDDAEPDFGSATPQRAHDYIFNESGLDEDDAASFLKNNVDAANNALEKLKKKEPKMGTSIAKFNKDKAEWERKVNEAQAKADYWKQVKAARDKVLADRLAEERRQQDERLEAERKKDEAALAAEREARKKAEAERRAVGVAKPMPAITEKWSQAEKVDGRMDEIVLADGTTLTGHYVLHESGASSASHDVTKGFAKTEGFPLDVNDNSVNDRDYEKDRDAQDHTRSMARRYDQRALQSVPVVSADGVVLSGNGRTMAGELASAEGTDVAYVDYLKRHADRFGFTEEQVGSMAHPRVAFVPDEALPYTAETFARFNKQDMKSQSKTEAAVKLGKTVSDDVFGDITRVIHGFETLSEFYNNPEASLRVLRILLDGGVLTDAQMAEMVDGVRGDERLSAVGRDFLENVLVGKAFASDPDVVRMLTAEPSMRSTVVSALVEITDNLALGDGYTLARQLSDAVRLCYDARKAGYKFGEAVSIFARQGELFAEPDELQTAADFNNATMLMLADVINSREVTKLRKTLALYNDAAREPASGQMDMFAEGGIRSREDVLRDVINYINKNGRTKAIKDAVAAGVARRREASVPKDGVAEAGIGGSENAERRGGGKTPVERKSDLAQAEPLTYHLSDEVDEKGRQFVLTSDGNVEFGKIGQDTGLTPAPILLSEGMITNPETNDGYGLVHIEARHGEQIRNAGYKSVLEFIEEVAKNYEVIREGKDRYGQQTYMLQLTDKHNNTLMVELSGDGTYWNINTAGIFKTSYGAKRNVVYNRHTTAKQSAETVEATLSGEQSGTTPSTSMNAPTQTSVDVSASKGNGKTSTAQEQTEKVAKDHTPNANSTQAALSASEQETNTEPTEAQKGDAVKDANEPTVLRLNGEERSVSDIENFVKEQVLRVIEEGEFDAEIVGVKVIGSYMRGEQTSESDLDVLVEYRGKAKEDALFDAIAEEGLEINGVNVDINPITKGKSGTIEEFIKRNTGFSKIAKAEGEVNTEPTEAQKKAGNYRKGHVRIDGFDVSIEQPKGSVRRGTDADGKKWEQEMHNTYGYIRGTEGVDGDHIDVFFSDDPSQGDVFVVDQVNKDGSFDEHKVMYGFPDIESARKAYLSNYEDGWTGLGAITPVSKEEFKKWISSSHRKTKPFADYKNVKAITEDVDQRRTNVNEEGLVVDAEGNPLTLYHGTPNDVEFSSLESGHVRDGEETPARFNGNGISFTPDRTVAVEYATSAGGKGKVFEVNVTLKKPYFTVGVANFTPEEASAFTEGLMAKGYDGIINYSSKWMRDAGALPNEVIVFDMNGVEQNTDASGPFGTIYTQFKGKAKEAIDWLKSKKEGKAEGALHHHTLGDISLVWGDAKTGLAKIVKKHPEVLDNLQDIIDSMEIVQESYNRIKLESETHFAVVSKEYKGEPREKWLLTAYEKKETSEPANSRMDVESNLEGASDDTATRRDSDVSEGKVANNSASDQGNGVKSYKINSFEYITKRGKKIDMKLVTFESELSKEQMNAAKKLAKDHKGWWSKNDGGFLMRDAESAQLLAESVLGDEGAVEDAQPVTLEDMKLATAEPVAEEEEGFHGGDTVWSRQHGENKHILMAHHAYGAVQSYTFTDGTKAMAQDVEAAHEEPTPSADATGTEDVEKKGSGNKIVTDERYEQLKARMRKKLGQLNVSFIGIDSEMFAIGTEMAVYHIEKGARQFIPYAKAMIEDLGDAIRPYLKSFYNGARDLPEIEANGWTDEMTPYDEVRKIDVANFDKNTTNAMATADMVVKEEQAAQQAESAKEQIIETRNNNRNEAENQTETNTRALADEAAAVESETESVVSSGDAAAISEQVSKIDEHLEKVNKQLAILGYYEADTEDPSKFHESYGYMKTAEKKAVADAHTFSRRLCKALGMTAIPKRDVQANIAPIGGDVTFRIPFSEGKSLYFNIWLDNDHDNLSLSRIMYRVEEKQDGAKYWNSVGHANNYLPNDVTVDDAIMDIKRMLRYDAPELEIKEPAASTSAKQSKSTENKPKSKKNSSPLQKAQQPDLFGDLFSDLNEQASETSNGNNNETTDVQSRTSEEGRGGYQPQQDAQVGRSAGHEAEGSDRRGMGGRSSRNTLSDGERNLGVSGIHQSKQHVEPAADDTGTVDTDTEGKTSGTVAKNTNNNHAERGKDYAPKGVDARIESNIKAIELMQQLMLEGKQATPAQMKVLRQYSGWGGLGKAFNEHPNGPYSSNPTTKRLKELLGDEAFRLAEDSKDSAFYTPAVVIDAMWDIARAMGFKGGTVLEGSAGIGNIIGAMPTDMSKRSDIHAVEIDETTGNILSLLYPDAKVDIQGFEQTKIANGSVDLAITNVPFVTGLNVRDVSGDLDLSKKFKDIHDFCIAKNVRKLREGGIGIFITSSGTLDNSQKLRNWLVGEGGADVVGAFRLHNKTFGGAKVTSDIIVVRKRVNGQKSAHAIDVSTVTAERTGTFVDEKQRGKERTVSMDYNKYFMEHPECMAGEMFFGYEKGDNYRPLSKSLYPVNGKEQESMLATWLKGFDGMKEETQRGRTAYSGNQSAKPIDTVYESLGADVKEGSMVIDEHGRPCIAQRGKAVPLMSNPKKGENVSDEVLIARYNKNKVKGHTKAECFQSYQAIKSALADVLSYQTENEGDEGLKPLLDKMNKAYDGFVKTYGHLHKNTSISFLKNDVDFPNILALEKYSEEGDKKGNKVERFEKTDIFKQRVVEKDKAPEPKNVKDGIIASIYQYGRIDVPYITEKLGKSVDDVKQEIVSSGLGFENPNTLQMEVSYEYLSGNVREKLRQADEANDGGKYAANIEALRKVIPMDIPAHLIDFTLGSSWVEPKLYEDYIKERTDVDAQLTNVGGTWYMKVPYYVQHEKNKAMGVRGEVVKKLILGSELIEAAMQNKTITVSETRSVGYGSNKTTETITDKEATQACAAKIDEIRADFKDWAHQKMQSDAEMSARIERAYNEQFNNYVPVDVSMEFVPEYFGGANHKYKMRQHQAKAIVRGTMQPLLLAHEVGTGKTFTLISTAMEMRRLGTAKKPMIVVQNATVGQFVSSAKELYPNAKVLTLEDKDRNEEGRKNFYAKIKYNDWDMIVVPQSVFERIPDSDERQMRFIQDKIDEKMAILEQMREADEGGRSSIVRQAEKEIEQLKDQLGEIGETAATKRKQRDSKREHITRQNTEVKAREMLDRETDDVENFDDMGIDALLVDEAHEYKHLGFATAMQRGVKGIDPSYSKKSQGVYLKTQAVLEKNNGRNVIFATGTPISNTAAEIWTFMRYLMPADTMKDYGIYYFDDFVRNFGNLTQMLEFTTNGKFKENNRFAGYVNLPELVRIWSIVADTVRTDEAQAVKDNVPDMEGGKAQDIYLPQTRALRSIMKFVKAELERFEKMSGKEKKENSHIPLTMYGVAKAAAVDARLVMADAEDDPNSKTNEAVRQTLRSLKETAKYKGTVALFADIYQNKHSGFNLYDDIREKLIAQGVPADEVVVIRSGMTVKKKQEIFDKVNRGEIRVILGSTFTLGTGVNIQERLHTLIHLDAPNRPMDYTQRNGRIVRQGNLHKDMGIPVRVLRFGVQDSLDVTAYQRLKTKGAIADSIMRGKAMMQNSMEDRAMEEDEDVFGDTVAQLSGSQYAMLKNQAEREVRKYESKRKQWQADQTYVHNAIPRITAQIAESERNAAENNANLAKFEEAFGGTDKPAIKIGKHTFADIAGMADFFTEQNKKVKETEDEIRKSAREEQRTRSVDVQIGNITFTIKTTQKKELSYHGGTVDTKVSRSIAISCPELGIEDMKGGAYFKNAMENIFNDIVSGSLFREDAAYYTTRAERLKGELELVKSREGQPFQYDKELEDARQKLDEYTDLMKKEMEEKEKKYAEMDSDVEAATGVTEYSDEEEEDENLYRVVEDKSTVERLESEPKMKAYRAMQVIDGRLYSPMAAKVDGKLSSDNPFDKWTEAEETAFDFTPEQIAEMEALDNSDKSGEVEIVKGKLRYRKDSKNGKGTLQFHLVKGDGTDLWAAYNPYIHSSLMMLNDQFTSAYKRPNIVVVEVEIPESELTSGYRAKLAKDAVGMAEWKAGPVAGQLPSDMGRKVMLSRWSKVKRIVPYSEVADHVASVLSTAEQKKGEKLHLPIDSFHPELRKELEKRGFEFEYGPYTKEKTDKKGNLIKAWDDKTEKEKHQAYKGAAYIDDAAIQQLNDEFEGKWMRREGDLDAESPVSDAGMSEMVKRVNDLAAKLHLDNIEIVTDTSMLEGKKKNAKGFYNRKTGKISIVVANHNDLADLEKTVLHEAVAHHGLRKLFGEHFDTFLDTVYRNADEDVRRRIVALAAKYGWDFRKATEEYIAGLAEDTDFENAKKTGWWEKIKRAFLDMLHKIAFDEYDGDVLTDNDLRYILWRSYSNLENGEHGIIKAARNEVMKQKLLANDKPKTAADMDENVTDDDIFFRQGDPEERERTDARYRYEQRVKSGMYQTREAMLDSMLGLHEAMKAIYGKDVHIEDIADFENAYLGENRLSSINQDEWYCFEHLLIKPLLNEVSKLEKDGSSREEVTRYMMAKHGLERNEIMAARAAKKAFESEDNKDASGNPIKSEADFLAEYRERDFGGITGLMEKDDLLTAEGLARQLVEDFENKHDTTELWAKVNNVSKAILSKQYECGMMNKDTYDDISSMYAFYIPLRGFDEKTSEEAYAYLTSKNSAFNAPIKKAHGRKSVADDPLVNLQTMAQSSILMGNRNKLVKQRFLNFVLNHPSNLVSVNDLWVRYDDVEDEWKAVFPDNINDDDSSEVVEQKMQDFEQKMQQLAKADPKHYKHGKDTVSIPYRVVGDANLRQHQVLVKRNGRDYVLTINGNPRAAQALNGLTNSDNELRGSIGSTLHAIGAVNRTLSGLYTTMSIDFVASNFLRDTLYSNSMVWIKESPRYAAKFNKNYVKTKRVMHLLGKYRNGTLDMNNKTEKMFYQFMKNGGETGYMRMIDIDGQRKQIKKALKGMNEKIPARMAREFVTTWIGEVGRGIEMRSRFAAFITSREMGRTIGRSIWDAKEISVNFNKKGAGDKFFGATGQTFMGNTSAFVSGAGRGLYLFWNAALQGTFGNFGKYAMRHKGKAATAVAISFGLGLLITALASASGDDDDDSYFDQPEHIRRQNIVFKLFGKTWGKIPLPIEYRAVYGLGELAGCVIFNHEKLEYDKFAKQLSQVLPVDLLEGYKGLYPSALKPAFEAANNETWYGTPIWKDTPYNKHMPEWTKSYKSTDQRLVALSETLNELSGGSKYKKGAIDINPAKMEYLLKQYSGGLYTLANQLGSMYDVATGDKEFDWRHVPVLNRMFMTGGDERNAGRGLNEKFFKYMDAYDAKASEFSAIRNDLTIPMDKKAELISEIVSDPEYLKMRRTKHVYSKMNQAYKQAMELGNTEAADHLQKEMNKLKRKFIDEMEADDASK